MPTDSLYRPMPVVCRSLEGRVYFNLLPYAVRQSIIWVVIATVTKKRQVVLPAEVCQALGIKAGVRLDFRARKGKLEAVKISTRRPANSRRSLKSLYSSERNSEELIIQTGCSCEVPEDFPK